MANANYFGQKCIKYVIHQFLTPKEQKLPKFRSLLFTRIQLQGAVLAKKVCETSLQVCSYKKWTLVIPP